MVNGKWLMNGRSLLTLNESELMRAAQDYAKKIDVFLIQREQSVFSKLVALGGSAEEESFEVQVKVKMDGTMPIPSLLDRPEITVIRTRHYRQHDIYFSFKDTSQGWLRYREDEMIDSIGKVSDIRSRLTLIGPSREGDYNNDVLLSRIRFFAPATNSPRFYREYFKPDSEIQIDKDRIRWLIRYKDEEFFVNYDHLQNPSLGDYLEIKSRTWSRKDAEEKASCVSELITLLGGDLTQTITDDYVEIAEKMNNPKL
jgi:5-methylthioadenosine/S-adenosylhomocysteine deaminase